MKHKKLTPENFFKPSLAKIILAVLIAFLLFEGSVNFGFKQYDPWEGKDTTVTFNGEVYDIRPVGGLLFYTCNPIIFPVCLYTQPELHLNQHEMNTVITPMVPIWLALSYYCASALFWTFHHLKQK